MLEIPSCKYQKYMSGAHVPYSVPEIAVCLCIWEPNYC